jgi:cell division protein FtsZ
MEPAELAEPAIAEPAAARDQAFENMMSSVAGAEAAMEAPMAIAEPEPVAQPEPEAAPEPVAQPVAEAAPTVVATAPPSAIEAGERRGVEAQEPTPEDSFVAPPPVEPDAAPEIAVAAQAEPFAAAAMANASRPSMSTGRTGTPGFDRKKAQSLFAKMTVGAARAIQAAAQAGEPVVSQATETRAVASGGGGSTLRPTTQATPEPTVSPAPQPASREPAPPKTQPRLSGLDPKNRATGKQTEEDLLEIPAFLRRQAN